MSVVPRTERSLISAAAVLLASLALILAPVQSASAFGFGVKHNAGFLGFWEGIDPLDGSSFQLSISDLGHDGTLDLFQRESFYATCFDSDSTNNTKGRAKATGVGTVLSWTVLSVDFTQTCLLDDNTEGEVFEYNVKLFLKSKGKVLFIDNQTTPDVVLHRTSD